MASSRSIQGRSAFSGVAVWTRCALVSGLLFVALLGFGALPCLARARTNDSSPTIAYQLRIDPFHPRRFAVKVTIPRPGQDEAEFAIPAWAPGYYQILHFENAIEHVRAEDDAGHSLRILRPGARRWTVDTHQAIGANVTLSYEVFANDKGLGFFGSMLDNNRRTGYINGPSAFMYVVGQTQAAIRLSVDLPPGWRCATPLTASAPYLYMAATYDEFVDAPLQLGLFQTFEFRANGVPFQCVVIGDGQTDSAAVSAELQKVAKQTIDLFGSAPFSRYIFFYHIGESGFIGGLEHRSSTVIHLDDPIGDGSDDGFLTTSAHELFHAWNVKRLRPEGLGPFDYSQSVRTSSLWFAEGVTDYYADLIPVRAGLRSPDWFAEQLGQRIRQLDGTPARARVSLEQAGRGAWEGNSEGLEGLSYYIKGSLVGLYFDLRIRLATDGRRSLDDVLRELDSTFGGAGRAYPETAIGAAIDHVARMDLGADYRRLVSGVDDIPWNEVLPRSGLALSRQADGYLGISVEPEPPADETDDREEGDRLAIVQRVERGYPAEKMDIRPGDVVLSIDDRSVTYGVAGAIIRSLPAGVPIRFTVRRQGRRLELTGEAGTLYSHQSVSFVPVATRTSLAGRVLAGLFAPAVRPEPGRAQQP